MKRKLCDILVTIYISFLLIYLMLGNAFRLYKMYTTLEISEILICFGVVGVVIYFLYKIINRVKFDIYDGLIFLLIIFGIISVIYAFDSDTALFGFRGRYEGFLQIVTYYLLFLNCKNMENNICKKIIISVIIILCCIQAFYAVLQFTKVKTLFGFDVRKIRYYSNGFEVNPNFLGSLMSISLSLSLGIFFMKKNIVISILTLITSTMLFYGFLCSGAMSAVVSFFGIVLILIMIFLIFKPDIFSLMTKFLLIIGLFLFIYSRFNIHDKGYYMSQVQKTTYEMGETIKGDAQPIYGSGRIHIWKESLSVVPDNLWNGIGIDNFFYAFGFDKKLIDVKSNLVVDKAHNEYLQKLVTEGIFSLLIYLVLIFTIFIKSGIKIFRYKNNNGVLHIVLFLGFTAYCIQAFFNISIISVAPYFYIVMGLLCSLVKKVGNEEVRN